jgi:hypothetical protein
MGGGGRGDRRISPTARSRRSGLLEPFGHTLRPRAAGFGKTSTMAERQVERITTDTTDRSHKYETNPDELERLVTSDPFMRAFALTLARRVHSGGAMVLGLYVETMVATALGGEQAFRGTDDVDVLWHGLRIQVKATVKKPRSRFALSQRRNSDGYVFGVLDVDPGEPNPNYRVGWRFLALTVAQLDELARNRKNPSTNNDSIALSKLPDLTHWVLLDELKHHASSVFDL